MKKKLLKTTYKNWNYSNIKRAPKAKDKFLAANIRTELLRKNMRAHIRLR